MSTGMARRMSRLEAATEEDKDFGFWFGMLLASVNGSQAQQDAAKAEYRRAKEAYPARLMSGSMRSSGRRSSPEGRTTSRTSWRKPTRPMRRVWVARE